MLDLLHPVSTIIVDEHPLYASALCDVASRMPRLEVIGTAGDTESALGLIGEVFPGLVLVGVSAVGPSLLRAIEQVHDRSRATLIVVLTAEADGPAIHSVIASGANACLSKRATPAAIRSAVKKVLAGGSWVDATCQADLFAEIIDRASWDAGLLSSREGEILAMMADGMSAPQIARSLHLSPATIRTHLQHLFVKLGTATQAATVATAMRRGLLS